ARLRTPPAPTAARDAHRAGAEVTSPALEADQAALARLLIDVAEPAAAAIAGFDPVALRRARAILRRKRIDDALPLLEQLAPHADALRPVAERVLAARPRARRGAAIGDAVAIARAVVDALPGAAAAARRNLLVLRAR